MRPQSSIYFLSAVGRLDSTSTLSLNKLSHAQAPLRLALGALQGSSIGISICLRLRLRVRLRPPGPRRRPLRRGRRGQGPRRGEARGVCHKGRRRKLFFFFFGLFFNLFFKLFFFFSDVARPAPGARRQAQLVRGRRQGHAPLAEARADLLRPPAQGRRRSKRKKVRRV